MAEKRFYWLKLKEDYFNNPKIKKLRKIAGGDTFTIVYLKMQLLSVSNKGIIEFEGIEETFEEELALKLDEDLDNVSVTLNFLKIQGLIESNNNEFLLLEACKNIGSESESAERVRLFREREKQKELGYEEKKKEPKSNALRQRQHQAKKKCEEKQHIPYIEDYINNKRYNGNYYLVIQRDRFKCSICGSIENLCVHHIDGYSEEKSENSEANKMITLCRNCHSNVHSNSLVLDEDLLNSIEYYNEMLPCNNNVTCVKQSSISISNSISNNKVGKGRAFTPPTFEEIEEYAISRGYQHLAKKFFEYYTTGDWRDSKGNKIKNWKQKFITWEGERTQTKKPEPKNNNRRAYSNSEIEKVFKSVEELEL